MPNSGIIPCFDIGANDVASFCASPRIVLLQPHGFERWPRKVDALVPVRFERIDESQILVPDLFSHQPARVGPVYGVSEAEYEFGTGEMSLDRLRCIRKEGITRCGLAPAMSCMLVREVHFEICIDIFFRPMRKLARFLQAGHLYIRVFHQVIVER